MKNRGLIIISAILLGLIIIYLAGPRMPEPDMNNDLPEISLAAEEVGQYIENRESMIANIRPDNNARVVYADDSIRGRTAYCLVYLHGFTACWKEGDPVHMNLAEKFGMNAYYPRLAEHGLETPEPLLNMTPDTLWESVKEAIMIGKSLGDKIILMGTSTGATLALKVAAEYPDDIEALVLLSPNVRIFSKASVLLARPWGLQIARLIFGGLYRTVEQEPEIDVYWYDHYRLEATVYLQQMIEATMKKELFEKVGQPVFIGYYYKDEENQDDVVRVSSILWMFENLGTPDGRKVALSFPDAGAHVIGCDLFNPNWEKVYDSAELFLMQVVKLVPHNP